MRIRDIVRESVSEDIVQAVGDILSVMMANEHDKISTRQLQSLLRMEGHNLSTEQLIMAAEQSGYASSQDRGFIVPKSEMPAEVGDMAAAGEYDQDVVGDLAKSQAMSDIDSDLT
jgi:hypothetical protein